MQLGVTISQSGASLWPDAGIVEHALMTKPPLPASEPDREAYLSTELQSAFGDSVRGYRLKLGWKQSDLSERCGIDQSVISKIERGEFNLTIKQMSRLANALDGDVTEMLKAQPTTE